MFVSIVMIDPPGPLYIPILTQKNITCSITEINLIYSSPVISTALA